MELPDLPRKVVLQAIGVVMQEPFLYSKSIRDNLYVGKGKPTDQDLETALADAVMAEGLDKFNNGIDSMVGERGVTLSGGQGTHHQLLALRGHYYEPYSQQRMSAIADDTDSWLNDALLRLCLVFVSE